MAGKLVRDVQLEDTYFNQVLNLKATSGDWIAIPRWLDADEALLWADTASVATGVGIRGVLCPKLEQFFHYDVSLTGVERWVDGFGTAPDLLNPQAAGGFTVTAMATGDFLYAASHERFEGLFFDMSATVSNNVAAMTMAFNNNTGGWTTQANTDLTKSSNTTLAIDGTCLFDVTPSDALWNPAPLRRHLPNLLLPDRKLFDESLYWIRLDTSAVLDDVAIDSLVGIHKDAPVSATAGIAAGAGFAMKGGSEYSIRFNDSHGGMAFVSMDATANIEVNVTWIEK
jgi:hypothetical protein